jgi:cell wall-associated NlpC family hydrolase
MLILGGSGTGAGRLLSGRSACRMPAPPPRHPRARPRRLSVPLRWLSLAALTVPLLAGVGGVGRQTAEAAPGSPAAVAVRFALAQLGKPYQWGADGPGSFDCSGLVQTSYKAAGVYLPRVSRQQCGAGKQVSLRSLRAGDLLFYARVTSNRRTIYHVGMYLGAGRMVEAPTAGRRSASPRSGAPACSARRPGRRPACGGCSPSSRASAATPWPPSSSAWPPTSGA